MSEIAAGEETETLVDGTTSDSGAGGPSSDGYGSRPAALSGPSGDASVSASRVEAHRLEAIARIRLYTTFMIALCALGFVLIPVFMEPPLASAIFAATLTLLLLTSVWARWETTVPSRYNEVHIGLAAQLQALAAAGASYYFGVCSPVWAVVAIAIFIYSLGAPFRYALAVYVSTAAGQAIMAALLVGGVVDRRGIIDPGSLPLGRMIAIQATLHLLLAFSFLLSRLSRRRSIEVIEAYETAVRSAARREALLHEARQELGRAAQGIGEPGRFTEQVLGSFRLGMVLGRGAIGEVYEASHVTTGDRAAVKLLHRSVLGDAHHVARFLREAKIARSLTAPNVVRVIEIGDTDAALPYIAMERLDGQDLGRILRRDRRFSSSRAVAMVGQVAAGLDAAHAAGIVHRDLKPANLVLAREGQREVWKVLDFGVSKLVTDHGTLTRGAVVGTPMYMAPEQARGEEVDRRADVFSLAVIAYRALTGQPAFSGRDSASVLHLTLTRMPICPSSLARDLPEEMDAVLAVGLAKAPSERFDTAGELARALSEALQGRLDPGLRARADKILDRHPWTG